MCSIQRLALVLYSAIKVHNSNEAPRETDYPVGVLGMLCPERGKPLPLKHVDGMVIGLFSRQRDCKYRVQARFDPATEGRTRLSGASISCLRTLRKRSANRIGACQFPSKREQGLPYKRVVQTQPFVLHARLLGVIALE